jgi:hypothetical protein
VVFGAEDRLHCQLQNLLIARDRNLRCLDSESLNVCAVR